MQGTVPRSPSFHSTMRGGQSRSSSSASPFLLLALLLVTLSCSPVLAQASSAAARASMLPPDALALLTFKAKADPGNRLSFHAAGRGGGNLSSSSTSHCRWPGVSCSAEGRVVRLVLEAVGLNGTLADAGLGRLDQLRILSLKANALAGPAPDLGRLANLKALYLDHNLLSGPLPASVASLRRLRVLDVSHNNLSGGIPSGLAGLDRLMALRLEENHLDGTVPPFNQSSLRNFNVSSNNLTGAVPVTPILAAFGAPAFAANPGLCGEVIKKDCNSHFQFFRGGNPPISSSPAANMSSMGGQHEGLLIPGSASRSQKAHRKAAVVIGFLTGAFAVFGVLGILFAVKRNKKREKQGEMIVLEKGTTMRAADDEPVIGTVNYNEEIESTNNELAAAAALAMSEEKMKKLGKSGCLVFCAGEAQVYTLEQLMRASAEMLGKGGIGTTYKAVLDNRLIVSVKRLDAASLLPAGKEAFERHMDTVGTLRHPNLVPLRAYFQGKEERLLVYDYQPNGSLYSLIHGSRSTRAKPLHWTSCLKIAEDVAQGLAYIHQARLVHGNIKSSNVLLGSDFEACLTDNCLSFLIEPSPADVESGYRAPESRNSNQGLTPRSDIYAFGVLLLELLTGKLPSQHPVLIAADLPVWVRSVREDEGAEDERLMMITDIAAACVRPVPESRPTTWQVLKMVQEVKEIDAGDNDSDSASIS